MEGQPKPFAEKSPSQDSIETSDFGIDSVESIERALELQAEIHKINEKGDIYGPEAMTEKAKADKCEAEFIRVLATLSDGVRNEYHLPQRSPVEKRPESNVTPFPVTPPKDYIERLGYIPRPSADHSRVDAELPRAA